MKKLLFFSMALGGVLTSNSQIKVWPGGQIGYGTTSAITGTVKHQLTGNVQMTGDVRFDSWTDLILDGVSGDCCSTPVLYPESDWYFQLGTSSKFLGTAYISHMIYRTAPTLVSDARFKQNIDYNTNSLEKLLKLKPATYNLKKELFASAPEEVQAKLTSKKQYGLIAQEVNEIFPELVEVDEKTGNYGIQYTEFIPILIDAFQQQQKKIEALQTAIGQSSNVNINDATGIQSNQIKTSGSYLHQNSPNPFSTETAIAYNVIESGPSNITIFDMSGKLIKTLPIKTPGSGKVTISANDLQPGMYYYSLIVNNKEIDTKKMILTN